MTESERVAWDRRYSEGDYIPRSAPAPFLEEWLPRLPGGRALDVACGAGRNALRLAQAGYRVDGIDVSQVAVDRARAEGARRGLEVSWRVADLDEVILEPAGYDVITVIRYVNRLLWPQLVGALTPDGWLLIEHHFNTIVEVDGPASPEFRLEPQELLAAFASLRIVYYSETLEPADIGGKVFAIERMVACKGNPGW